MQESCVSTSVALLVEPGQEVEWGLVRVEVVRTREELDEAEEPSAVTFVMRTGEALLDAALAQGVPLPHGCRVGVCGACAVEIAATDALEPADPIEADSLSRFRLPGDVRLACRARCGGAGAPALRCRPL